MSFIQAGLGGARVELYVFSVPTLNNLELSENSRTFTSNTNDLLVEKFVLKTEFLKMCFNFTHSSGFSSELDYDKKKTPLITKLGSNTRALTKNHVERLSIIW